MSGMRKILDSYASVLDADLPAVAKPRYGRYAVSCFRGGVGKSTLTFNLAYELSRVRSLLLADMCPQKNVTEAFLRGRTAEWSVLHALTPRVLGPAFGEAPEDISYRASDYCTDFKGGKRAYFVPSDAELFAFPSALYQQLNQAVGSGPGVGSEKAAKGLLLSLRDLLQAEAAEKKCKLILIDTSPFYAGGTHLSWCAAEALIIPVKVDEASHESLELTLQMLTSPNRDYVRWNKRAGNLPSPRVAAIAMTMVGSKGRTRRTPDRASQMFIERALELAYKYPTVFDVEDPADAFVLLDDFMSSGRISGAKSIPIAKLKPGQFHTVGNKRLQVNASVSRYKKELRYLASIL